MFAHIIVLILFVSLIDMTEIRSGFGQEYSNINYTSLIRQTNFIVNKEVDSKLACSLKCLSVDDCSMVVFNETNFECMIYNIYPVIDQELLPDNNIIVFVFEQIIERKFDVFLFIQY
jgi:hypothetical protein